MWVPKIKEFGPKRKYIFTAIDRISKLGYLSVADYQTKANSAGFLTKTLGFYPYRINYILTDNGIEFSYNQLVSYRRPKTRLHPFDQICRQNKIQHRTIKFKHPWTNGMVERFNGKIKDKIFRGRLFQDVADLKMKLTTFINDYNFTVRLKQLDYQLPAQYLKDNFNYSVQRIVI